MPDQDDQKPRWTVGSLSGQSLGATPGKADRGAGAHGSTSDAVPASATPSPDVAEGPGWVVVEGTISTERSGVQFLPGGNEALTYSNPFAQNLERVWFDDKIVYAVDVGEVDVDPSKVKVAQEYQIVHAVELDDAGKLKNKVEVEGQYNIYDSVPGMAIYSPIWQFNYVVVPQGYQPNTLRSARACEASGYRIVLSNVFEN